MAQRTKVNIWREKRRRQEEWERTADLLLEDMQRFLPASMEPTILSSVKDYMVAKYDQAENYYDRLVVRHEAIKIQIRDVEKQLADLTAHAQALSAVTRDEGPIIEAAVRGYDVGFTRETFRRAMEQVSSCTARLAVCDAKYMMLRTRNESLEQEVQKHRTILQRREQELERTRHILTRVEAERDRSSRTADYVIHQANDLERRLRETDKLYRAVKRSQQDYKSAHSATSAPAAFGRRPARTSTEPWTKLQRETCLPLVPPQATVSSILGFTHNIID